MAEILMAENPVLREIRRPGPDRFRLAVPAQDEEFIVHQLAVLPARADRFDMSLLDGLTVSRPRAFGFSVAVESLDVVKKHVDDRSAMVSFPDGLQRRRPL